MPVDEGRSRPLSGVTTQQDILASQGTNQVSRTVDLYDSEIIEIEKVMQRITDKQKSWTGGELGGFDAFIQDEFERIGFKVDVKWWHTDVEGVKMPEIELVARTDRRFQFDRDRQVHEVTNDLLNLGEGGVIKTTKEDMEAMMKQADAHGHGHSHSH